MYQQTIGIGGVVTHSPPSRPGEFHPEAESARGIAELHPEPLTDPDLNLSIHPARATP